MGEVQIVSYKVPLIDKDLTMATYPIAAEDIEKMPRRKAERNPSISGDYSLSGKVLDNKSGDAIQFAVISLYSSGKVVARTISNAEGRYSIVGIRSGKFFVKVSADDFNSKTIKDFKVSADAINNLNIQLK